MNKDRAIQSAAIIVAAAGIVVGLFMASGSPARAIGDDFHGRIQRIYIDEKEQASLPGVVIRTVSGYMTGHIVEVGADYACIADVNLAADNIFCVPITSISSVQILGK